MTKKLSFEIIQQQPGIQNPVHVFLANKRPGTRETYEYCLNKVARKLGMLDAYSFTWQALRFEHTTFINAWLSKTYGCNYAYKNMASIRGVLRTCRSMGLISADDYWNALEGCKVRLNEVPRPSAGRMLSPEEIQKFLRTCQLGPRNRAVRDAAIFMVMVGCGLRVGEVGKLRLEEFDQSTGRILVHGKGRKTRTVYLVNDVRAAVDQWLKVRGNGSGALFLTIVKSDQVHPGAIHIHAVWQMLKDRQAAAKVRPFTPHDLRRTFISNMLGAGVDVSTVASIAGHKSPNVTMAYDRRNEDRKVTAAATISIQFEPRGEI